MSAPFRRRRTVPATILVLVAGVLTACAGATTGPAAPPSPAIAGELALATFDSAWSRIDHSYYDPDFRGMDWGAVRDELRPRAAAASTVAELRAVIREMLGRLGESHFALIPRESVDDLEENGESDASADAGMDLRWVGDTLVVARVHDGGAAAAAGVSPGWVVEAIGERRVADWVEAIHGGGSDAARLGLRVGTLSAAAARLAGPEGSTVMLRLRDGEGRPREVELSRRPVRGERVQFGNLPPMYAHLEHERIPVGGGGCVGVIRFTVWMLPVSGPFNEAVDQLAECRGMVVDIRGNPGGVGGMVMGVAGSFFDEQVPLGVMTSRSGALNFVAMPRRLDSAGALRETYDGPLAVLVDEGSMSTSEIFAAGLQAAGRARIFGTPTPGYALPATMLRLPNQDVLYHAIANLTDQTGRRIEGQGVIPDQVIPLHRADLLAGRDAALEAAVAWVTDAGGPPPPLP